MNSGLLTSALILAGSVVLIFWQAASEPVAPALQQATAQPPLSASTAAPIRTSRIPSVRLLGLLHQGNTSSAVLEVAGMPARTFHAGDSVGPEWRLRTIGPAYIVLADEEQEVRLELDAKQVDAKAQSIKPTVVAPLARGAFEGQPNSLVSDEVARERNQQFIEAMRRRAAEPAGASP